MSRLSNRLPQQERRHEAELCETFSSRAITYGDLVESATAEQRAEVRRYARNAICPAPRDIAVACRSAVAPLPYVFDPRLFSRVRRRSRPRAAHRVTVAQRIVTTVGRLPGIGQSAEPRRHRRKLLQEIGCCPHLRIATHLGMDDQHQIVDRDII
jgi:hypothetical protein